MREQNIYDDPSFFDGYQKLRQNPSAANDLVEKPALFSLLPDVDEVAAQSATGLLYRCFHKRSRPGAEGGK